MRLVQLAGYTGPYAGSFVPMLRAILNGGRQRGWDVEAVFVDSVRDRPWLAELEGDDLPYRFFTTGSRATLRRDVSGLLAERPGPAILHTHFTTFDLAAATARAGERPLVYWHIHSRAGMALRIRLQNAVKYGLFGRRVERILCVAPDIADSVRRRGGGDRVKFWPNAIDTERFPAVAPARRRAARAELDLPADAVVLMHFGWDWERKGGDIYLRAVVELAAERAAGLIAVTVGDAEAARSLGAKLGLGDSLCVRGPSNDVGRFYAAADVFVSSSRAEGMPFAMTEALASGLPVVATEIPGQVAIGESLGACRLTGLSPDDVAAGIRAALAGSPEQREAEGRAARAEIEERMGLAAWAERLLALYEQGLPDRY